MNAYCKTGITHAPCASGDTAVYLERRRVGTISKFGKGYAFVPSGQRRKDRGEIYASVAAVLASLEGEA